MMISYMMKTMRERFSGGEEPGFAGGVYQDMFYEQVAKVIGSSGTLGLGRYALLPVGTYGENTCCAKAQEQRLKLQKAVSSQVSLNKVSSNE